MGNQVVQDKVQKAFVGLQLKCVEEKVALEEELSGPALVVWGSQALSVPSLDSWPSLSTWRRLGPLHDSCLKTQRRGPVCA